MEGRNQEKKYDGQKGDASFPNKRCKFIEPFAIWGCLVFDFLATYERTLPWYVASRRMVSTFAAFFAPFGQSHGLLCPLSVRTPARMIPNTQQQNGGKTSIFTLLPELESQFSKGCAKTLRFLPLSRAIGTFLLHLPHVRRAKVFLPPLCANIICSEAEVAIAAFLGRFQSLLESAQRAANNGAADTRISGSGLKEEEEEEGERASQICSILL